MRPASLRAVVFGALAATAAACAPIPKPAILDEVDRVSQAEAAKAAKAAAMPTWALAEKRRLMAHELAESGPLAHAEFVAEESIATYEEGASLAVVAAGTRREAEEQALVEGLSRELTDAETAITETLREIDALEARLRIAKADGLVPGEAGPFTAEERALYADVLWQGTISCTGAGLLRGAMKATGAATDDPLPALAATREKLAVELAAKDAVKPDRAAFHAYREACLKALTGARANRASGKVDQLMTELSRMLASATTRAQASRDERGVRVAVPGLFDGRKIAAGAAEPWAALARVAKAHPEFPVAVVVYRGGLGGAEDVWSARRQALAESFPTVIVADAASSAPAERSDGPMVELIFISPEAL